MTKLLAMAALATLAGTAMADAGDTDSVTASLREVFEIGTPAHSTTAEDARSNTAVYSDITTFSGQGTTIGGATSIASNAGTKFLADRMTLTAGGTLDQFTFSVANFATVAVSARPRVRFYAADGPGGTPGTIIGGFSFNPISFASGNVGLYTASGLAANNLTLPSGDMYAAIFFDGSGASPVPSVANLNLLGVGMFNPPTVGSSGDSDWASTLTGGSNSLISNPTGATRLSPYAGNPVANYGWEIRTLDVPAPGAAALMGLVGVVGVRRRRA